MSQPCASCCSRCRTRSSTRRRSPSACRTARSRRSPATSTRIIRSPSPIWCSRRPSVRRTVERLIARPPARSRRPVGHDVPARHGATDHLAGARHRAPACASSSAATTRAWRRDAWTASGPRHRLHRPRRRRADVPRSPARDRTARCRCRRSPDSGSATSGTLPAQSAATGRIDRGRRREAAEPRGARALGLHDPRPPGRRGRDVARLHLRLQLLLDHRDARPQLSPLPDRAGDRRHRRRQRARRPRHLLRRRQHHARRPTVRGAVPGHHRRRPQRHRLHRAGDDVAHRVTRRRARAADEAGGVPLRVPRHRERARRRPRVPEGARQEQPARTADARPATRRSTPSTPCTVTASSSSAA